MQSVCKQDASVSKKGVPQNGWFIMETLVLETFMCVILFCVCLFGAQRFNSGSCGKNR